MNGTTTRRAPPPAYQVYAANRIADRNEKAMSLSERGLRYCIELECWCNGSVPVNKRELARVLSLDQSEVENALTDRVMRYFEEHEQVLVCPELETYRQLLERRHEKQSAGGKYTAAVINKRRGAVSLPDGLPDSSLVQDRTNQSKTVFIDPQHDEFVRGLEGVPEFMDENKLGARIKPGMRD